MNFVCTICHERFIPSDDISFTRCGHIFHLTCLSQWLTRSSSCPQCREKTSQNKIRKLYITYINESSPNNTDHSFMQEKIDNLKFQILLNEKNINYYTLKNESLTKQNAGLRQEVRKVEKEINEKNTTIHALTERMKFMKEKYESLRHKLYLKNKEAEKLKDIKTLLHDSVEDAEEIIEKTKDHNTLVAYILAMKKDMSRKANEQNMLHDTFNKVQNMFADLILNINTLVKDQSKKAHGKGYLAAKNWDLHNQIDELTKLLNVIQEIYLMKSNNQRKKNGNCFTDIQNTSQTNTKQETRNQDDSFIPKTEIEAASNVNQDEYPIHKKRAKLNKVFTIE